VNYFFQLDRYADVFHRGQDSQTGRGAGEVQRADGQVEEWTWEGTRASSFISTVLHPPRSLASHANFALSIKFTFPPLLLQDAIQQRALRTLKQKRMYEAQIAQLTQQTFNMESAALATDNLRNTMATVDAMQIANKEMRKQYGKIDIDKIEVRIQLGFHVAFSIFTNGGFDVWLEYPL
jgi:hypothetical protein